MVKGENGCPWYVPQAACDACEQACKEKVTPILVGAVLAALLAGYLIGKN